MGNVNELVVGYLAAWNERDAAQRRALIARVWTEDAMYVDAHRRGVGHDGIDSMIATAQSQFNGYVLRLASSIEAHNGYVRFSWAAGGTPEAPLLSGRHRFRNGRPGRSPQDYCRLRGCCTLDVASPSNSPASISRLRIRERKRGHQWLSGIRCHSARGECCWQSRSRALVLLPS